MATFFFRRSAARFALQRSAADFEIFSAARFSAAGMLALERFAAAVLRFTAAALRCSANKHKRCSAALQR